MRAVCSCLLAVGLLAASAAPALAQVKKPPARKPAAPPPAVKPVTAVPEMTCPTPLGTGTKTQVVYCDVNTGRDPAAGVVIQLPPHKGPVTVSFDLHNRHTYSEEQVRAKRGYAKYTATIGVLTLDNTLIGRAVVQNEFRSAADLVDRIGGGAGPGGVKAVAPTGTESIQMSIPEAENAVSILGEKVTVERLDGTSTYSSAGRPIAVISNVQIEYRPAPPKPAPRKPQKKL